MLSEPRRLLSAAVAIVLGVTFVAASLFMSDALDSSMRDAAAGTIGDASVVVSGAERQPVSDAVAAALSAAPGVTGTRPLSRSSVEIAADGAREFYGVQNTPALSNRTRLLAGRLPLASGEVAPNKAAADGRGLKVGDRLTIAHGVGGPAQVSVVGILDAGVDATDIPGVPMLFAPDAAVQAWSGVPGHALIFVSGTGTQVALRDAIAALPAVRAESAVVQTAEDAVQERIQAFAGGGAMLVGLLLGFAVVSLFVSALVIANTFAILVAQRTKTLALLRCVGATRGQVFRAVLGEAALLGAVAGMAGLGLGYGLARLAMLLVPTSGMQLTSLVPTATSLTVPVIAGLVVTLLAAMLPARNATQIAPLAALRAGAVSPAGRTGRLTLVLGVVALAAGLAALVVGGFFGWPVSARGASLPAHLLVGMGGGLVSFVGIVLLGGVLVPAVARLLGPAAARLGGVAGALASENAVRNPKRAAATASALLVGVTLITMMSVAAASGSASVSARVDARYPVDAVVSPGGEPLAPGVLAAVRGVHGVERAEPATTAFLEASGGGKTLRTEVYGVGPAAIAVARNSGLGAGLSDDTIVLPAKAGIPAGTPVTFPGAHPITLRALVADRSSAPPLVTTATLARLAEQPTSVVWVRFADGADALAASTAVGRAAASTTPGAVVGGAATERQAVQQVVDTALAVVIGLLAVAVVIALVGIGNTLSLSVLERTQESGLLRALGLTRRELRRMVGVEAVLLAGVAVVLGLILGLGYGIAGTYALLAQDMKVVLDVPWLRLGLVAAVALLAGWAASVLPAARASRVSPAAALAAE